MAVWTRSPDRVTLDALDAELLARIRDRGKPASIPELFDRLCPRWATAAAERLVIARRLHEDADGRLHRL